MSLVATTAVQFPTSYNSALYVKQLSGKDAEYNIKEIAPLVPPEIL